jgi:endonuclease/exonuclease/phosphatase family metal-dependent hydrolase
MKTAILKILVVACLLGALAFGLVTAKPVPNEITVMSYNIRCFNFDNVPVDLWARRQAPLIKHIKSHNPDIIGMQEVTTVQGPYLDENLPEYAKVSQNRDMWLLSESNPIYYKKSKFTLIDSGTFWLSETPEKMSVSWNSSCYRICTYAVLRHNQSGKIITHFNTHLDHKSALARENGLDVILERIQAQQTPAILTGDFNLEENTPLYLTAKEALDDTKHIATETMDIGSYHGYGAHDVTARAPIDFIFVTKGDFTALSYKVLAEQIDGVYTSDHYAIKSVLKLN